MSFSGHSTAQFTVGSIMRYPFLTPGKEDVMATTQTFAPNQLYAMPLADLQADPNQPRKYLNPVALDELTASVKEHSVIAPITFRVENGICDIVANENDLKGSPFFNMIFP